MEKETLDNILENRQSYMMDNNMQQLNVAAADDGVVGGLQAEVVSGVAGEILGGKYDEHHEEHDVGDDDELKYVEEVQQSEKQQQHLQVLKNIGLDDDDAYKTNELAEKETDYNAAMNELGNGNGGFLFGEALQRPKEHDLFKLGNGHDTNGHDINVNEDFGNISTGFEDKLNMMESDLDGFKNDGDFSSTSNATESVEGFVPQVDVEIETKIEQNEMVDEEEPSSLATNTTNGTSSMSENVPPQAVIAPQANAFDNIMASLGDNEISDPIAPQRPNELDLEHTLSQLNPDAKEFIPSFGSNPASPTSPFAGGMPQNEPILSEVMETKMYFGQAPSIAHRNILDDDIVASSPCKGKCDSMDAVSLPEELKEFEQEADTRPHECLEGCEQNDEVMTPDQAMQQLPLDDIVLLDKENHPPTDSIDFHHSNFMDHGPETSVDLELDFDVQTSAALSAAGNGEDDVMKRSMYVTNDDAIEDVLNSVQPIPTEIDSLNNSFIEESATESAANQLAVDKELLQVEEKEHVSHSPSTEEIQMNLQNILNSSNRDISQLPTDFDNATNMQDSVYVEQQHELKQDLEQSDDDVRGDDLLQDEEQQQHVIEEKQFVEEREVSQDPMENPEIMEIFSKEIKSLEETEGQQTVAEDEKLEKHPLDNNEMRHERELTTQGPMSETLPAKEAEECLYADATHPLISKESFMDNSMEIQEHPQEINESFSPFKIDDETTNINAVESSNNSGLEHQEGSNLNVDDVMTPPFTADEKHLLEDTKEQQLFSVSGLEKEMGGLILNNIDDDLSQAEEIATAIATDVIEDVSENIVKPGEDIVSEEVFEHQNQPQEQKFVDDSSTKHEQEEQSSEVAFVQNPFTQHEQEESQEQMFIDDSFTKQHEQPQEQMFVEDSFTKHEQEQRQEQLFVDDSFSKHERECLEQYQEELQREQERIIEAESKPDPVNESIESPVAEPIESPTAEPIESPIEQQQQPELGSGLVAVEEPIAEAKNAAPLFHDEEKTEIVAEKIEKIQELPPSMVPETAAAESLEPAVEAINETENILYQQEQQPPQTSDEVKPEIIKDPEVEELEEKEVLEPVKEEVVTAPKFSAEVPVEAAIVAAFTAVATTAAVATKVAETEKKPLSKTTTAAAAKPKVAATTTAKKPTEVAKKAIGVAAKPRTVPAKPTPSIADKKPIAKTTSTSATVAARKPLSATTRPASKIVAKSTSTTSTTRTATSSTKTTTTSRLTAALAKPRPTTTPAKPTTLGLPATNGAPKSKTLSPRTTATSQVRKSAPATTAAKSPIKPTPGNGVTKTTASTLASRTTKTTTTTVSSTAGTVKTFTARPAPKFTSSSSATTTTTTARRLAVGASHVSSTTTTTTKTSSTGLRKSTPSKPTLGKTQTPTKAATTAAGLKQKTPNTKTASPPEKPSPIRKPVNKTAAPPAATTNGEPNANKELNGTVEEQYLQASTQNGDLQTVKLEQLNLNGDSSIPMQTDSQEPPFLGPTCEQTTIDLINA